jgi:alpha-1,4-digalacturonate transport system substrate-binding protein
MVINKTAFDKAGVSYPVNEEDRWTWDEFLAAVKKVVANSDCDYGLVVDHSQQRIKTILYQFGSSFADASGKKIIFDSPETRKALQFIVDLYKDGVSPVSVGLGTDNAQSVFKTGKAAAHLAGNWVITDYTANIKDFEWTPVLMPYEKEKATSLARNWLYAFKGTGVEKEAVEFINWFYKPRTTPSTAPTAATCLAGRTSTSRTTFRAWRSSTRRSTPPATCRPTTRTWRSPIRVRPTATSSAIRWIV